MLCGVCNIETVDFNILIFYYFLFCGMHGRIVVLLYT